MMLKPIEAASVGDLYHALADAREQEPQQMLQMLRERSDIHNKCS
jgi:hypothetical protein